MGGVPVKHHSKSKVGKRRSHQFLKPIDLAACSFCQAPIKPHTLCLKCGKKKLKIKNLKSKIKNS